jgi:hypothetical protein
LNLDLEILPPQNKAEEDFVPVLEKDFQTLPGLFHQHAEFTIHEDPETAKKLER